MPTARLIVTFKVDEDPRLVDPREVAQIIADCYDDARRANPGDASYPAVAMNDAEWDPNWRPDPAAP